MNARTNLEPGKITASMLNIPSDLDIPSSTRPYLERLNLTLSANDAMYAGNDRHYLSCGASALEVILLSLRLSGAPEPGTILDFGAGAGRVTRWLRAAFPHAQIDACDLRSSDMDFCASTFGASTWISGIDLDSLRAPQSYSLIWLGSVATHLTADTTKHLIRKMISWCSPGGLVVMSFHGRHALNRQNSGEYFYIDVERWTVIQRDYEKHGFGYSDYEGQAGYGISVAKLSWIAAVIEELRTGRLICLSERAWDGHHDVLAVQAG